MSLIFFKILPTVPYRLSLIKHNKCTCLEIVQSNGPSYNVISSCLMKSNVCPEFAHVKCLSRYCTIKWMSPYTLDNLLTNIEYGQITNNHWTDLEQTLDRDKLWANIRHGQTLDNGPWAGDWSRATANEI